jgi:hypothetical protein
MMERREGAAFGFGAGACSALLARSSVKRKEGKAETTNKKKEDHASYIGDGQ